MVSRGWEPERTNLLDLDGNSPRFVPRNEWQGTRDPAAYLSVPVAIQFHGQSPPERQRYSAEHDWPRVRADGHTRTFGPSAGELLREARQRIEELGRGIPRPYKAICPDSPEWYAQMAAFLLCTPERSGVEWACRRATGALQRRMCDEFRVEVPFSSVCFLMGSDFSPPNPPLGR